MITCTEVDVFARDPQLEAALTAPRSKPRIRYRYAIKRYKATGPGSQGKRSACSVVHLSKQKGLAEMRELREAVDGGRLPGVVAVISRKLAVNPEFQKLLRGDNMRFIFEEDIQQDPKPLRRQLDALIDSIEPIPKSLAAPRNDNSGKAHAKGFESPYLQASEPIRNPENQRLDARRIIDYFDLSFRELASIIDTPHPTIAGTPDGRKLQARLQPFEAILRGRILVDMDDQLFKRWLQTPQAAFQVNGGRRPTPMDLIRAGHLDAVAGLVDRALMGAPA